MRPWHQASTSIAITPPQSSLDVAHRIRQERLLILDAVALQGAQPQQPQQKAGRFGSARTNCWMLNVNQDGAFSSLACSQWGEHRYGAQAPTSLPSALSQLPVPPCPTTPHASPLRPPSALCPPQTTLPAHLIQHEVPPAQRAAQRQVPVLALRSGRAAGTGQLVSRGARPG